MNEEELLRPFDNDFLCFLPASSCSCLIQYALLQKAKRPIYSRVVDDEKVDEPEAARLNFEDSPVCAETSHFSFDLLERRELSPIGGGGGGDSFSFPDVDGLEAFSPNPSSSSSRSAFGSTQGIVY